VLPGVRINTHGRRNSSTIKTWLIRSYTNRLRT
jgi:hypothetical protein